jgi:O-antigen ligase
MFFFDFSAEIQNFLNLFWWQINFLLLAILVILGYLAVKKPVWAVCLTIILLPTYLFRSKIWFLPFTYLELCIWITFIGWIINRIMNYELGIKSKNFAFLLPNSKFLIPLRYPIILTLLASTISVVIASSLPAAAGIGKAYFVEPILFFLILASLVKDGKNKEKILWALGISTLSISLLAIFQKFTGWGIAQPAWIPADHRRVTAMFTSPNAVGLYLGPVIMIYLGWLTVSIKNQELRIKNIFRCLIILFSLLAVIFTVSQGTWLGLAAGLIFFCFFAFSKKWTAGLVLLLIIISLVVPLSREKLMPVLLFQDASGQSRLVLWGMAKDYLISSPKNFGLGAGIGGFAEIQNKMREPLKMEALLYPHNIFLNFWLEIGLLGLIGFIWVIILFFKNGSKYVWTINGSPLQIGVMAAMVCLLVHGLIDVPYFKNDLAIIFWLIIGLL